MCVAMCMLLCLSAGMLMPQHGSGACVGPYLPPCWRHKLEGSVLSPTFLPQEDWDYRCAANQALYSLQGFELRSS